MINSSPSTTYFANSNAFFKYEIAPILWLAYIKVGLKTKFT